MNKYLNLFSKSLFGISMYAAAQLSLAGPYDPVCSYTNNFRDTFQVIRQDRPVTVTLTDKTFGFSWAKKEYPTDASWEFKVNLTNADQVKVRLRQVVYDDNMYIYVNGQEIFGRIGGGVNGYDANLDVGRFFIDGENTIRVRLINDIPQNAAIGATFEYSEGGCTFPELPRPPIPPLPDMQRCVEQLVCTQPVATKQFAGQDVKRGCWQYKTTRTCYDFLEDTSTCKEPTPPTGGSCEVVSKQCLDEKEYKVGDNTFKGCTLYETRTKCTTPIKPEQMTPTELAAYNKENAERQLSCKPVQTCIGPNCYIGEQEKDKPDEDMPYILALLEIGNQAGKYMDKDNIRLFNGVKSQCRSRRGFGALAACCKGGSSKPPKATDSNGKEIVPTNENAFANTFSTVDQKYSDPNATANQDFVNGGANPYTYDSMYAPNEALYMLQGTSSVAETKAGQEAFANGGGSKLTAMGYGYTPSGTATGDQKTFAEYSQVNKSGTRDD
ncbi:conjugal transfer protein TraN [Acinetobacter variabilis]|uniref:conjugal transfer protein TraN n=1 Tax=Acinetobacter variabilis TaxID=70346 RepID=UPI003B83D374